MEVTLEELQILKQIAELAFFIESTCAYQTNFKKTNLIASLVNLTLLTKMISAPSDPTNCLPVPALLTHRLS